MLEAVTAEMFAGRVGERFSLCVEDGRALDLVLLETTVLGAAGLTSHRRAPFSILFRGPDAPVLPQRIYAVGHEAMGRLEIFLVPLGPRDGGMVYEAIFT